MGWCVAASISLALMLLSALLIAVNFHNDKLCNKLQMACALFGILGFILLMMCARQIQIEIIHSWG